MSKKGREGHRFASDVIRRSLSILFRAFSPIVLLLLGLLLATCGGGGDGGETGSSGSTPIATTLAATTITSTNANLNGTAIPNGLPTRSWFEFGEDSVLTTFYSSPKQDAGNGVTSQAANLTWISLTSGATYHFRFYAENSKGTSKGQIVSFTTSSPGKTPYLAKVPYTTNVRYSNPSILEYNAVVDELVAENFITVSPPDFYTLFFQNTSLLDADGLHPNGTGYQSMADLWFSALP